MFRIIHLVIFLAVIALFVAAGMVLYPRFVSTPDISLVVQNNGLNVSLSDEKKLVEKLKQLEVIDDTHIKKVKIIFSTENRDAMYSQVDPEGKDFISSRYSIDTNQVAIITMYTSPYFLELGSDQKIGLLNYYFWEIGDLLIKRNTATSRVNDDHATIFILNK